MPELPSCPADALPDGLLLELLEDPDAGLPAEPDDPDGELLPDGIGGGWEGDEVCGEFAQPPTASAAIASAPTQLREYRLTPDIAPFTIQPG